MLTELNGLAIRIDANLNGLCALNAPLLSQHHLERNVVPQVLIETIAQVNPSETRFVSGKRYPAPRCRPAVHYVAQLRNRNRPALQRLGMRTTPLCETVLTLMPQIAVRAGKMEDPLLSRRRAGQSQEQLITTIGSVGRALL